MVERRIKINVKAVSKTYAGRNSNDDVLALSNIGLQILEHEFVSVVGPSGCGKSTLLSMMAGFAKPSSGEILYEGIPISGPGPERGVMFQDYALFPWRSVKGNVAFGPLARGINRDTANEVAQRYIDLVGLAGFEKRYPHELSGGMRQRCALARLLANEPAVWLMDEPLAAVDLQTRAILQEDLLRVWGDDKPANERKTVVFITHGIDEAVFLSDKVVVLGRRPGSVIAVVDIDLPRPRTRGGDESKLSAYTAAIWASIRGEAEQAISEEILNR